MFVCEVVFANVKKCIFLKRKTKIHNKLKKCQTKTYNKAKNKTIKNYNKSRNHLKNIKSKRNKKLYKMVKNTCEK